MYQVLYRKWRPQTFADVSGQEHITTTLQNELMAGRLNHAYLFTGSRGTGKTTCAKILSKAVSCDNPVDGDPCGKCPSCNSWGAFVEEVQIFPDVQENGKFLRSIKFNFPIPYEGSEVREICWDNSTTVESVVLLEKMG